MVDTPNLEITHPEQSSQALVPISAALDDFDGAVAGFLIIAMADSNKVLTDEEALREAVHEFTGTLTAGRTITLPDNQKIYHVWNNTTGGFALTFDTVAGTETVVVAAGDWATLAVDPGFDVNLVQTALSGVVLEADFNAQTILIAVADDTPLPVVIAASEFVGRKATGDAGLMTAAEARTVLNVEDNADVTDAAGVAAAGAVMDSDISEAEGFLRKTGAGAYEGIKTNLGATTDPGASDDSGAGYAVGSRWINVTLDKEFVCLDAAAAAAVWIETTGAGGGGDSHPIADSTAIVKGSVDATKLVRVEADGLTTGLTRVLTMADQDIDLTPGSGSFEAADAGLNSIAGLTTAADRLIYTTALDVYAVATLTEAGRNLIDDADTGAQRTTLGLVIGTDVQAFDADTAKLDVAQEWTSQQNFNATTLTDAANISWNLDTNKVASVTLAGNRTLDNPTNLKDGATYILIVKQDATGTRTLAYGTAYKWPSGNAPVLSTGANDVDILSFISDGTSMFGVAKLDFS